jgi:plasma kallikrein
MKFQCVGGKCVAHKFCSSLHYGDGLLNIRHNFGAECPRFLENCCPFANILIDPKPPVVNPTQTKNVGCGYRNSDGVGFKIQGATQGESEFGEFPWMVAVLEKQMGSGGSVANYKCGGSLINYKVVLTSE